MTTERPPSVDALARSLASTGLPHPLLVEVARAAIGAGDPSGAAALAEAWQRRLLQPVINATGVLLHTNLGRAPVAHEQGASASNVELDLDTGGRGSRQAHAAALLARACGAEAALVVNNGAAAVLLLLAALASGRGVAVSRGELVEIGGSFRIPDVLAQSGARLVEVGTTNRTRREDFAAALDDRRSDVAAVLAVHRSNYAITGFTEAATTAELATLGVPLLVDLGSGLLDAACPWLADGPPPWLRDEPGVRQTLEAGAAAVTFSGDKLLGGPQAGIIAGTAEIVAACARHPLMRALRPGGLVLGALQDVALAYLRRDGDAIPLWRRAVVPTDELHRRAASIAASAGVGTAVASAAVPGGGTLPSAEIPSAAVAVPGDHLAALRAAIPPVIARVADGTTLLDLRAVDESDDDHLVDALRALAAAER